MKKAIALMAATAVLGMSSAAYAVPPFTEDFESPSFNNADADNDMAGVDRVASGTNGVTSAGGGFHAITQSSGNHFSRMGGYDANWNGGFVNQVDIYIDSAWGTSGGGFDILTSLNQATAPFFTTVSHLVDMVFVVGVDTQTNPGGSILVGASQNASGVGTGIGTGSAGFFRGGGGALAAPIELFNYGWHTFEWDVHDTGGFVEATLSITDPNSVTHHVHTWQLGGWTGSGSAPIATSGGWHGGTSNTVGGHRALWMPNENPSTGGVAFDNINLQAQGGAPIPVPAAAWAGMSMLGGMGLIRRMKRAGK